MRNISFSLTKEQIRLRIKRVTRRTGWEFLKPGDMLCAVEKSQGLGKGGKIVRMCTIRVVSVRREMLRRMTDDTNYGFQETTLEGYPVGTRKHFPSVFVTFFCESHKDCKPESTVTRIEFEYVDE